MADAKISALTALTNANATPGDFAVVVDISDTTMAASGTTKKMTLADLSNYVNSTQQYSFTWDSATSSPAAVAGGPTAPQVTPIHTAMRRCVVNDAGAVVYYLSATNSALKADGSASVLTGADGQVMVEIPKFYARRSKAGTVTTWSISATPLDGFTVHPAFVKDSVEQPFRYVGAYDAAFFDTSAAAYSGGTNEDAKTGLDVTLTTGDKLASVAGQYPLVGIYRSDSRKLAANRGTGWRQLDFWLVEAIEILYVVEYQTFYTQLVLGAGNTNGSYGAASNVQTDSPHTIAGASNALGNTSTNATTGAGVSAKPGTSFMSYRGIENWYGNAWKWVDGFNINNNQAYVSNTTSFFADDTSTGYTALGAPMPAANGYVSLHQDIDNAFLPAASAGSSSTYWTDHYSQASGWRVAIFGGSADSAALAGGFYWGLSYAASSRDRRLSARLAR